MVTVKQPRNWDYSESGRSACAADMQYALQCLDGRWKMSILAHLLSGDNMRFSELQRAIPNVSQKMLTQQLRDLERERIISRTVYPEVPPRVEYNLTELGEKLRPVFVALLDWAVLRKQADEAL